MATTTVQTVDLAQLIASTLEDIDGLRVHWYVADIVRAPAVVVGQPSVDYLDQLGGFCSATWSFPLTLVVARTNDREAQVSLSTYLQQVTSTLSAAEAPGVHLIEAVRATPTAVTVSGQDLPGYAITVRVRA